MQSSSKHFLATDRRRRVMKKNYTTPEINLTALSNADILNGSDVLIDGSSLFDEQ